MLHGLGKRLRSKQKWTGIKAKKGQYMINKTKRRNCMRHSEQKTCKLKFNSD